MLKNMQTNFDYKYLPNFLKYIFNLVERAQLLSFKSIATINIGRV